MGSNSGSEYAEHNSDDLKALLRLPEVTRDHRRAKKIKAELSYRRRQAESRRRKISRRRKH